MSECALEQMFMSEKQSFLGALKWSYIGTWSERGFASLLTIVLAAVLGPKDFGLMATGLIVILFMQMILEQGLTAALIQRPDLDQKHCDTVFWINLCLSLILMIVTIAFSSWWARLNHAPELGRLLSVMSLSLPLEGLSIVQVALLRRQMRFKSLSIRATASTVTGGLVGIAMAFGGFQAWSLVGQQLTDRVVAFGLLWNFGTWRPKFDFSWKHLRDLMPFSFNNFLAQLGTYADFQAGFILLGLLFGPVAVGLYRLADRFVASILSMAVASIQVVSLPQFSRVQDRPEELRQTALACVRLSTAATAPILAGMAAASGDIMAVLGPKWIPATNVFIVLCLVGMIAQLSYFTGPLLQALGRTRDAAILEWARTGTGVVFLIVTSFFVHNLSEGGEVTAIALARFASTAAVFTPIFVYILMRICDISNKEFFSAIGGSVLAAAGVAAVVLCLRFAGLEGGSSPLAQVFTKAVIGGSTGIVILVLADRDIFDLLQKLLRLEGSFSSLRRSKQATPQARDRTNN